MAFLARIVEEGLSPASSDLHGRCLRHALNLSRDWGYLSGENPATRIPLYNPDNRRREALTQQQLESLVKVLREDRSPVSDCILILVLSGLRQRELRTLRWDAVDLEKRVLRIEATNSKSKRLREVPINDLCMEVIMKLDTRGKHEYLIVNPRTDKPYVNITKSWDRIRKASGIPAFHVHSLRRSFASILANSGVPILTISQLLGHSSVTVTQLYTVVSSDSLRSATNNASALVKDAMLKAAA